MVNPFTDRAADYFDDGEKELARFDEGWAKAVHYFRTGRHFGHPVRNIRCRSLVEIHEHLQVYKNRFEKGDSLSLLQAIGVCADENLPLPSWLAVAYQKALSSFLQTGGPASLDDVFHSETLPTDTPKKAANARQEWELGGQIWFNTWQLVWADQTVRSFDDAITKVLAAKNYGVGKTKAKELFSMHEKNAIEHSGGSKEKAISRFLSKRRKHVT